MATAINIANEALSEIKADQIASFEEDSVESNQCNLHYSNVVSEIMDRVDWPFAVRTVVLALVENDRPAEWNYCYAAPSDMANPIAIREKEEDAQMLRNYGLGTFPMQDAYPVNFIYEGGNIYCNTEFASLRYSIKDVVPEQFPPLLRRAIALTLAARIAYPIKADKQLAQGVLQLSEVAVSRAIADELNKNPRKLPRYTSDAEFARMGYI